MEKLAEALTRAMDEKGHSLREAAEELDVAHNTVDHWRQGWVKGAPKWEHIQPLADYIGVNRVEILGWLGILEQPEVESLLASAHMRPYVNSGLASAA